MTRATAPSRRLGGVALAGSLLALVPLAQTISSPKEPVIVTGSGKVRPANSVVRPWREPLHWAAVEDLDGVPIPLRQEIAAVRKAWIAADAAQREAKDSSEAWPADDRAPSLRRARVPDRGRLGSLELWWLSGPLGGELRSMLWLRDGETGERTTRPADLRSPGDALNAHELWVGDLELDGELELVLRVRSDEQLVFRESFLAVNDDLDVSEELTWAPLEIDAHLAANYRWMLRRELRPTGSLGLIATTWLVDLDGERRALPCAVADLMRNERAGAHRPYELAGVDWAPGFELARFVATGSALLERDAAYFGDPLR